VIREPDPADARATRVALTERARDFRAVAEEVLADLYERLVERLSEERAAALQEALRDVSEL
jgi:DNA-binding MarR family transcriptional regulator